MFSNIDAYRTKNYDFKDFGVSVKLFYKENVQCQDNEHIIIDVDETSERQIIDVKQPQITSMDDIQWNGILDEAVKVLFPDEKKSRRKYTPDQVRNLFILVFGKKQQVKVASNACEINASTAAGYVNQVRPVFTKYAGLGREVDKTSEITKLFSLNKSVPTAAATRKVEVPNAIRKSSSCIPSFWPNFLNQTSLRDLRTQKKR
ncbi:hypothetical protein [Parasitella parasitica]|uniref:Uncharacterized protein n=1 Tax=Parasitella parasitica TaxID=35722 RepID=A0A0B7NR39_9FUNG|nr:hypothetical protein [Parasitella parasitica]